MVPNGNVARLRDGFEPLESPCIFDHTVGLGGEFDAPVGGNAAVGIVDEQESAQDCETLRITHLLIDKNAQDEIDGNQHQVLKNA